MSLQTAYPNVVLLLGAGFSVHAGLSTMKGFGADSTNRLKLATENAIDPEKRSAAVMRHAGQVFQWFQEYCKRSAQCVATDAGNMEEVFCVAEALRESGVKHVRLGEAGMAQDYSVGFVIEQIQLWLWYVYQAFGHVLDYDKHEQLIEPYQRFVHRLKHLGGRLTVLTTNYDIGFEYVATASHHDPMLACRYPWRADAIWLKDQQQYLADKDDENACMVCHLHGSTNFFEVTRPDISQHGLGGDGCWFGVNAELAKEGHYGESPVIGWRAPHAATLCSYCIAGLRAKYGSSLVPAIIPPTYAKFHEKPWLRETWRAAREALRRAHVLVAIGYSMPASDGFIRAMLRAAFAQREPSDPLYVVVVNNEDAIREYENFFDPVRAAGRLLPRPPTFAKWALKEDSEFDGLVGTVTSKYGG